LHNFFSLLVFLSVSGIVEKSTQIKIIGLIKKSIMKLKMVNDIQFTFSQFLFIKSKYTFSFQIILLQSISTAFFKI